MYLFIIKFIFIFLLSYTSLSKSLNNKKLFFSIDRKYESKFFNHRIKFLIIHYTALNYTKSLKILKEKEVSTHYLIPDKIIQGEKKIFLMTKDNLRAWHAGISFWQERSNLNDTSIGIEIVNLGYTQSLLNQRCWIPFSDYQLKILITLLKMMITKYNIEPTGIIGHQDIAPGRKLDPGPLFPWKQLAHYGIGAWYDHNRVHTLKQDIKKNGIDIHTLQKELQKYGYQLNITGKFDEATKIILQSFQIHFRANNFSGIPDIETIAILKNLIEKYHN